MKRQIVKSASIDVTYKCNLKCRHCFNSSGEHSFNGKELSEEEILDIANQLAELQLDSLCFCGGEPLLRKEAIYKAAKLLKEKSNNKLSINMVTNGMLMTEEVADKLKESGVRMVQVSLDGSEAEHHNWLRNHSESFNKAVNAIKILVSKKFIVGVAYTPTKKSIKNLNEFIDFCEALGVKQLRVQPIMNLGRASNISNYFLSYEENIKLSRTLRKRDNTTQMNIEWGDPLQHIIGARCEIPELDYIAVGAYGDLLVSPYLPVIFGNIRKHKISDYIENGLLKVWENKFLRELSKTIISPETLDISQTLENIPRIFEGNDIQFDLIENSLEQLNLELMQKYVPKEEQSQ